MRVGQIADVVKIVFAVGVTVYCYLLVTRSFKGSSLEQPFWVLTLAVLIFMLAQIMDLFNFSVLSDYLEILFSLVLLITLVLLYRAWEGYGGIGTQED